jgi:hypothetical protein
MPKSPNAAGHRAAMLATCLLALCSAPAASQQRATASVIGTVVDEAGGAVKGVEVVLLGTRLSALTGERGEFAFPMIDAGARRLIARRAGFRPDTADVELTEGDTLALWLELKQVSVRLDAVEVVEEYLSPRLRGFENRRLHNIGGRYVSPADIKAQAPTETSDLLRRILGIRLADSSHVLIPVSNRGSKLVRMGTQLVPVQCTMRIGVNGFLTDPSFSMNLISPNDIHGIEIYNGPASIPPEFNRTAVDLYCGIVMIWTKSGS